MTNITSNMIAKSMYSQCYKYGDGFILVYLMVDYHQNYNDFTLNIKIWLSRVYHRFVVLWLDSKYVSNLIIELQLGTSCQM